MKKIIALALALIMALSMGVVAFAAPACPGDEITVELGTQLKSGKITTDFTSAYIDGVATGYKGASYIESVKFNKTKDSVIVTLKENYNLYEDAKVVKGAITVTGKHINGTDTVNVTKEVTWEVNNNAEYVTGAKKASQAVDIGSQLWAAANTVVVMDEDGGYVSFTDDVLTGVVKMEKDEKAFVGLDFIDADTQEALEEVLGEDYDAIVETYMMTGKGFKNEVAYSYKAYEEDPHYFYGFDGEKLFALDAKYDADEDVDAYVFNHTGAGVIVITDKEIVLAEEETKNPDTGANDVVGVAAALAVVSLVAAGAVSLKK